MKATARLQWQLILQNSVFLTLLVAAALLGIYLLRDNTLQVDITFNKRNQISDTTRDVLKKFNGPLTITTYASPQGEAWIQIREFLRPYQQAKPDLALKFVDIRRNPKEAEAAGVRSPREMVIEYQGRKEHLTSLSEQDLTSLLLRLLRARERLVMYLDGHGEPSLEGSRNFDLGEFGNQLRGKGIRIQSLNLTIAPEVPDNCSVLVIAQPRAGLLKGEVDKIKRFLDKGGSLLWMIDEGSLQGLEPVAETLQIVAPRGVVVDPAGQELAGNPAVSVGIPSRAHPAGSSGSLITVFPLARPIVVSPGAKAWKVTPLVEVARNGWVETGDLSKGAHFDQDKDIRGPITVVAALEREVSGKQQRVVVTGSSSFLNNTYLGNVNNLDLGINVVNWLSADEELITVQPRARIDSELRLSFTAMGFMVVGFLFALPAGFLFAGGMIWWRRRNAGAR